MAKLTKDQVVLARGNNGMDRSKSDAGTLPSRTKRRKGSDSREQEQLRNEGAA